MFLAQRVFDSVMKAVQITVGLQDTLTFTQVTFILFLLQINLIFIVYFQLFPEKILKIVFHVTKIENELKIQETPEDTKDCICSQS